VFFLGQGLLEVSGHAAGPPGHSVIIWIQVRDVHAEHARLAAAGVPIVREPITEPWGLIEMWIEDPDGIRIVLVEVPAVTLSAVTRGRCYRRDGQHDAAYQCGPRNAAAQRPPGMRQKSAFPLRRPANKHADRSLFSMADGRECSWMMTRAYPPIGVAPATAVDRALSAPVSYAETLARHAACQPAAVSAGTTKVCCRGS